MRSSSAGLCGKRILIQALGCRTNIAEAEALMSEFTRYGALISDAPPFDAAVIVTCSITSVADRKSRQLINRLRREEPDACIVACGCWAQGASEEASRNMGVDLLVGNRRKAAIPEMVSWWFDGHVPGSRAMIVSRGAISRTPDFPHLDRSPYFGRAFIKVQDGCDHGCTYCIVPKRRGPSVSRSIADVVEEAKRCVAAGQFEIVLTGVHLGLFGRDSGETLEGLVRTLGWVDGLKRLRFGSLEPFSIGDGLLDALASSKIFCRHLHLPLQSGDDGILKRMGRGHTVRDFLSLVSRLRNALGDDLHISTDVMCAFPGESEEAFKSTLAVLDAARIGRVHGFRYSPRPGTPAAVMKGQIPTDIGQDRVKRLCAKGTECLCREASRWTGRIRPVLFEDERRGRSQGYTPEYLEFRPTGNPVYETLKEVKILSQKDGILYGE